MIISNTQQVQWIIDSNRVRVKFLYKRKIQRRHRITFSMKWGGGWRLWIPGTPWNRSQPACPVVWCLVPVGMLKTRGTIAAGCSIVEHGSSSFLLLNYGFIQLSSIDLQWIKQSNQPTVRHSWLMRYKQGLTYRNKRNLKKRQRNI